MPLSDIAQVSISTSGGTLSLPGFGTPLIAGAHGKTWPERVRSYGTLPDLAVDFAAGTPEYIAGAALFGQSPRPTQVKVGRCALPPTQRWKITPAVVNGAKYDLKVGAQTATYTADSTATAAEIVAGLVAAINGLSSPGLTASNQTSYVQAVCAAGAWQALEVLDVNLLSIEQDHADPGIATDLAAIQLEDSDWYALETIWNSKAYILAAAAWAEANEKVYTPQTQDTPCIATAESGATDVMKAAKDAAYARTSVWYDPSTYPVLDAGLLGRMLPEDAGSETWALKTVAGAIARKYTGTHLANLKAKRGNWYYTLAGVNMTSPDSGKVAANEWIDIIRGRDALVVELQGRVIDALRKAKKVSYTDSGATILHGVIAAGLEVFEKRGFISEGTVTVTVPKVADQSPTNRGNRFFPGIEFSGELAGAIHKLSIAGVLTP